MVSYRHYCNVLGEELYADTELIKWKGHRCYLHIYFDSIKSALDEKKFSHRILMEYEELSFGNTVKEHQKDYERFFIIKEMPKRGRKIEYNQEAIDTYRKNRLVCACHKRYKRFCEGTGNIPDEGCSRKTF